MDANVGRVEEELEQADDVQYVCTVVGQVDSEVQSIRLDLEEGSEVKSHWERKLYRR